MSMELALWKIGDELLTLESSGMDSEKRLEGLLVGDVSVLSPDWMVIGRQVQTFDLRPLDLLCIDAQGHLIVVELKRNKTEREVVAQVLDYASWVAGLAAPQIEEIFEGYQQKSGVSSPVPLLEASGSGLRLTTFPMC